MGEKAVTEVPGIGKVIASSMNDAGTKSAKQLYGTFLKDGSDALKVFVKSHGANNGQANAAAGAIKEWDEQNN